MLAGLVELAHASRARLNAKIIAVTGSVGKTSTKEALRRVLSAQGETHASVASFNNHWGVPLSLARCPASTRFAVFEIGMNHAGELLAPLTAMASNAIADRVATAMGHPGVFSLVIGADDVVGDALAERHDLGAELAAGSGDEDAHGDGGVRASEAFRPRGAEGIVPRLRALPPVSPAKGLGFRHFCELLRDLREWP